MKSVEIVTDAAFSADTTLARAAFIRRRALLAARLEMHAAVLGLPMGAHVMDMQQPAIINAQQSAAG